jgi:hypothetical protein
MQGWTVRAAAPTEIRYPTTDSQPHDEQSA